MKEETYQDRFVKEYIELKCRYRKLNKKYSKRGKNVMGTISNLG